MIIFKPAIPRACVLCQQEFQGDLALCSACQGDLLPVEQACQRCAIPLHGAEKSELLCGECLQHPPPLQQSLAAFQFRQPLRHLVHQLKFAGAESLAPGLAQLMATQLAPRIQQLPQALLPVPLHRQRWRQRGFNQSLLLAKHLGAIFNIPVLSDSVIRLRHTLAQAELDETARRSNVARCFQLQDLPKVQHIALIDDVMTTGSTLYELARTLLKQDSFQLDAWVLARAQA